LRRDKLAEYITPEYMKAGLWRDSFEKEDREWFRSLVDLYRPRAKILEYFPRQSRIFLTDDVEFDPAAVEKFLKDENARANLRTLAVRLAARPEFNHQSIEEKVSVLAAELAIKPCALMYTT